MRKWTQNRSRKRRFISHPFIHPSIHPTIYLFISKSNLSSVIHLSTTTLATSHNHRPHQPQPPSKSTTPNTWSKHVSIPAEAESFDGSEVALEVCQHFTCCQVPHHYLLVATWCGWCGVVGVVVVGVIVVDVIVVVVERLVRSISWLKRCIFSWWSGVLKQFRWCLCSYVVLW